MESDIIHLRVGRSDTAKSGGRLKSSIDRHGTEKRLLRLAIAQTVDAVSRVERVFVRSAVRRYNMEVKRRGKETCGKKVKPNMRALFCVCLRYCVLAE